MNNLSISVSGILPETRTKIDSNYSPLIETKRWGKEYHFPGEKYCVKIMEVFPGGTCSLHFHGEKSESFVLVKGQLNVIFYTPKGEKHEELHSPYSVIILPKNTPHIFSVPTEQEDSSIFIEASTPDDKLDNYRLTKSKILLKNV